MQAGALLSEGGYQNQSAALALGEPIPVQRILRMVLWFCFFALGGAVYLAYTTLQHNALPYTLEGLLALGNILSVARYSGDQDPAIVRFLVLWMYPAAILGGVTFVLGKTRMQRFLSFSGFLPALLLGIFQAVRAPSLIACCCWLSGFFATKSYLTRGSYRLFSRRLFLLGIGLVVCATCLFIALDAVRIYKLGKDFDLAPDWDRVRGSMLAYLRFSADGAEDLDFPSLSFGAYTFAGLFNLLGLHASV